MDRRLTDRTRTRSTPASSSRPPRPNLAYKRRITGVAQMVVPTGTDGEPDWESFSSHLERLFTLGLSPAVNMTANVPGLLNPTYSIGAAWQAQEQFGKNFFVGIHVQDQPGDWFKADAYRRQIDAVAETGGTPVLFPSHGMSALNDDEWQKAMADLSTHIDAFLIAEPGPDMSPSASIRPAQVALSLIRTPTCKGIVHASLSRAAEFDHLRSQAHLRKDFTIWSANERAIDMAMYGSDYMLLAAAMAPDAFARRDAMWEEGDRSVHELNDLLQYLAMFTSRTPVAAQAHSVLQFLHLRGWVGADRLPPGSATRPAGDAAVLRDIVDRLRAT